MNYNALLELATDLGYRLAMCGAETYRIEESIHRILSSYGIESEIFAIPNCLTVSIETPEGKPMTRMRRIGYHGNDLDSVEKYNNLSDEELITKIRDNDEEAFEVLFSKYLAKIILCSCGFNSFNTSLRTIRFNNASSSK